MYLCRNDEDSMVFQKAVQYLDLQPVIPVISRPMQGLEGLSHNHKQLNDLSTDMFELHDYVMYQPSGNRLHGMRRQDSR